MTLTRRNLLKNGVIAGGAVAVPVAAKTIVPPAAVVFDSRDARSRTFAALAGCSTLDVAQEDEKFWSGVRSGMPKGRIEGLTSWSDWVLVRGLLEERGLRVKQQKLTEICSAGQWPEQKENRMSDADPANNMPPGYVPPKIWEWNKANGGQFANINRPVSGATHEKELPRGAHALQLYSLGTPNGVKVTILLEELLEQGFSEAEYDAWLINIGTGDQFGSDYVQINPNSKIPCMMDYSVDPPLRLFESGSILFYLAEKFGAFLSTDIHKRTETMNWLMWQMASAPYVGGGLGHFYAYAPIKIEYAIDRFAMETKRQLHVLDTHLAKNEYMVGGDYTIADMAIFPWYGNIMRTAYNCQEFLSVHEYTHLDRWVKLILERPAVKRGRMVNQTFGGPEGQVRERHSARDFEVNRQDMVEARGGERI